MKKNSKYFFIFILLTLTTCKKYPENTLWFTNVSKIKFFDSVKLTAFTVNGIDSLHLLNNYFGATVADKNIDHTSFSSVGGSGSNYNEDCGLFNMSYPGGVDYILISYEYIKNKKYMDISFGEFGVWDTASFKRNLFIDNTTSWEIIKLEPKDTRKIKKTVNNNTYELQFDKF